MVNLGRPPIKERTTTNYALNFPNVDMIHKLDLMARAQTTSRRKLIISLLETAINDHEREGQTGLTDYVEGAPETDNLAFMRVTHLLQREKEVNRLDILTMFRNAGFSHPKLMEFSRKAETYLKEKGVKVWAG